MTRWAIGGGGMESESVAKRRPHAVVRGEEDLSKARPIEKQLLGQLQQTGYVTRSTYLAVLKAAVLS